MSFSSEVKAELCSNKLEQRHCLWAQCYGMLLFSKAFLRDGILFQTEHKYLMDEFAELVERIANVSIVVKEMEPEIRRGAKLYMAHMQNPMERDRLFFQFHHKPKNTLVIQRENLKKDCCKAAFIKGAFLACGSVTNPEKDYHLEFVVQEESLGRDFLSFVNDCSIKLKASMRKNHLILYIKESEYIEDILTLMGAVKSSLSIMELKILKDVRNKVNRMTNCETANIDKTVAAAYQQIQDIEYIRDTKGLDFLPDNLQEVAYLRLENQDASLSELSVLAGSSISRSGINHRLKRIAAIARELRQAEAASGKESK